MDFNVIVVCALLLIAVAFFVTEIFPIDTVALLVMVTLMLTGILTPAEGLSGFSHEATVTIAAMFVLSEGVRRAGTLNALGDLFIRYSRKSYWRSVLLLMPLIGAMSAFVNNTAAVAIFIPIMLRVADEIEVSPSRLLMPLSFAAMFGGVCTLIGTSTNILVSSLAEDYGIEPFGMFEFAPFGLIVFAVGAVYMLTAGTAIIPKRRHHRELSRHFEMEGFLTDITLEPGFEHLGKKVDDMIDDWELDLDVVMVFRGSKSLRADRVDLELQEGDVLRVHGSAEQIGELLEKENLRVKPVESWDESEKETRNYTLVEVVVAPDSNLVDSTLADNNSLAKFDARLLAVRRRGQLTRERLSDFRISGGDSLLLAVERDRINELQANQSFVVVSELSTMTYRRRCMPITVGILVAVVMTAALGLQPIVVTAVAGVVAMFVTGCLTPGEAYEAVHWRVIFLLAGIIPLGLALQKTGIAEQLATSVINLTSPYGTMAIVSGFFLVTMLLTALISNQATAALLAPIAIQAAGLEGIDPRPLLLAITFAASLSFMTPVGYQTNTMIYGPGQYRFGDFVRVGTPLNLILWILGSLLIPFFWPL